MDYLVDPIFQRVNRLFVLLFENNAHRTSYKQHVHLTIEIKDYNVMIDGKNTVVQRVKNNLRKYETIQKISTSKGDDCTTGFLPDYSYFKDYYKIIAINLSKQQFLDADP